MPLLSLCRRTLKDPPYYGVVTISTCGSQSNFSVHVVPIYSISHRKYRAKLGHDPRTWRDRSPGKKRPRMVTPRGSEQAGERTERVHFEEINLEGKPNRTTRYLATAPEAFRRLGMSDFSSHVSQHGAELRVRHIDGPAQGLCIRCRLLGIRYRGWRVQPYGDVSGVKLEVCVERKDVHAEAVGHGSDQEVDRCPVTPLDRQRLNKWAACS